MTINDQELDRLRRFLWDTGKFRDRSKPEALNVNLADLPLLKLGDEPLHQAIQSMQEGDANIEPLSWLWNARRPVADGDPGPATMALIDLPRCPIPDHPPLPGEAFDFGDPDKNQVVESYQRWAAATGQGSWPAGCHGTPGVHEVWISHDLTRAPANVKAWWPEIKRRLYASAAAMGVKLVEVPVGDPKANIRHSFKGLTGNTIGLAEFNSQQCGDNVFCYLDPSYAPNLLMVLVLILHEVGHNLNEEHRPAKRLSAADAAASWNVDKADWNGAMNPSIVFAVPQWVIRDGSRIVYQDNSYPSLKKSFGGEPIDGVPPVTPPPPTAEELVLPWKITDARGMTVIVNKV